MATTINSTSLDFTAIKNNLKKVLSTKDEFSDYNFEASGLSNILDVLAYNTHFNGLVANFALNEAYLGTAQLRPSLVSIAEGIGYVPDSRRSAEAFVRISIVGSADVVNPENLPARIELSSGVKFNAKKDDVDYTFQTRQTISAQKGADNRYVFKTDDGSLDIPIYEGEFKSKTFLVGQSSENKIYVLPDKTLDISTMVVRVFDDATSNNFVTYRNIFEASTINENSTLYIVKEAPNEFYELSFGDGDTLGKTPTAGNKVVVEYLLSSGPEANEISGGFKANNTVTRSGFIFELVTESRAASAGGGLKEDNESIRKNAPFQYATQNRMVTAVDYTALTLRNYSNLIKDINSWGGEDDPEPEYGTVFQSIVFNDNVQQTTIDSTKNGILSLANQLSIVSFDLKFKDPVETFIQTKVFFRFNPFLTTLITSAVESNVRSIIKNYFDTFTGSFEEAFRRSNLLTLIDESSSAILSSRCEVAMRKSINPVANVAQDFLLKYPTQILSPDDDNVSVTSSTFSYRPTTNSPVTTAYIRNAQRVRVKNDAESTDTVTVFDTVPSNNLQILDFATNAVLAQNVGSFNEDGTVRINGLRVSSSDEVRIIATPANQSAIVPTRNEILKQDVFSTVAVAVETNATN